MDLTPSDFNFPGTEAFNAYLAAQNIKQRWQWSRSLDVGRYHFHLTLRRPGGFVRWHLDRTAKSGSLAFGVGLLSWLYMGAGFRLGRLIVQRDPQLARSWNVMAAGRYLSRHVDNGQPYWYLTDGRRSLTLSLRFSLLDLLAPPGINGGTSTGGTFNFGFGHVCYTIGKSGAALSR